LLASLRAAELSGVLQVGAHAVAEKGATSIDEVIDDCYAPYGSERSQRGA
jgi:hypothetical protein